MISKNENKKLNKNARKHKHTHTHKFKHKIKKKNKKKEKHTHKTKYTQYITPYKHACNAQMCNTHTNTNTHACLTYHT